MAGLSTVLGSNQTFSGTPDADTVTAQSNDTVSGFDGNDSLSFTGTNDTINGNIGNDTIESTSFAATADSISRHVDYNVERKHAVKSGAVR